MALRVLLKKTFEDGRDQRAKRFRGFSSEKFFMLCVFEAALVELLFVSEQVGFTVSRCPVRRFTAAGSSRDVCLSVFSGSNVLS